MVRTSVLNDALVSIVNAERSGKRQVLIRPSSKVIIKFLEVMMKNEYIGEFEVSVFFLFALGSGLLFFLILT
jgi:small subunit ribosomal protein S15Ae